jgi:4-carboxymuconolactone decarboxylase
MDKDKFERGMQVRRDMYGPARADDEFAATTDFNRPLQEMITTWCFGEVWTRPAITRRERSMITIAMMIALNRPGALQVHVEGGLKNGVSKDDLREVMLTAAVYCGVAAANDATRIAGEVLKKEGQN